MKLVPAVIAILACLLVSTAVWAQQGPPADLPDAPPTSAIIPQLPALDLGSGGSINPVDVLEAAGRFVPKGESGGSTQGPKSGISAALNILVLLTVVSLAPSIVLMTTCFMRVVIVLGLLKQAIGTQSVPPSQVIVALALFMTLLVMTPTIERIHNEAVVPYRQGQIAGPDELWNKAKQPVRDFMFSQIEATGNWNSLYMILDYRGIDVSSPETLTRADVDMVSLVPAYMLSELKTAFLMGFRVYLPFLVIDMVVSGLLISMSMMMLPPVLISLPFKLLLFVLVDGWALVVGSLMSSFVTKAPAIGSQAMVVSSHFFGVA